MKRGSATLFAIVAMIITGIIFSYIFSRTANSQINNLTYFNRIKDVYEKDLRYTNASDNIKYDSIDSNIYENILSAHTSASE